MRTTIYLHVKEIRKDVSTIDSPARTSPVSNIFSGPKGVQAIEVRLFIRKRQKYLFYHQVLIKYRSTL